VRSRCFRVRLGLVGARDIEAILADQDVADPPTAARLGRLAGGHPGVALAYARAPEAVLIRGELTRALLDLTDARPAARLAAARAAVPRAIALSAALAGGDTPAAPRPSKRRGTTTVTPPVAAPPAATDPTTGDGDPAATSPEEPAEAALGGRAIPPSDRRRGVEVLLGLWASVARDIALVGDGGARSVADPVLIEETTAIAATIEPGAAIAFLERLARAAELLESNLSPELVLDSLVLAWPSRTRAA
jgi:DNA polymerase-3 subunit delta'